MDLIRSWVEPVWSWLSPKGEGLNQTAFLVDLLVVSSRHVIGSKNVSPDARNVRGVSSFDWLEGCSLQMSLQMLVSCVTSRHWLAQRMFSPDVCIVRVWFGCRIVFSARICALSKKVWTFWLTDIIFKRVCRMHNYPHVVTINITWLFPLPGIWYK
jgi:hypothetical protein